MGLAGASSACCSSAACTDAGVLWPDDTDAGEAESAMDSVMAVVSDASVGVGEAAREAMTAAPAGLYSLASARSLRVEVGGTHRRVGGGEVHDGDRGGKAHSSSGLGGGGAGGGER